MTRGDIQRQRALDARGVRVTAEVIRVNHGKTGRTSVRYTTTDGRSLGDVLVGQGDLPKPGPAVGERIPIVYDPLDPAADVRHAAVTGNKMYLLYLTLAAVAGIGPPMISLFAWRRRSRRGA